MKQNNLIIRELLFLLLFLPCFMFSQNIVTGTVNGESGESIPFANVIEKDTSNGVTTNMNGTFSIEVSNLPVTLVFSSLGFTTIEQEVNASPVLIVLVESTEALEEVVITGLATSV